ncbi:MAG: hypothetical protein Kow0069_06210 [Promethearchaeota archaeon]
MKRANVKVMLLGSGGVPVALFDFESGSSEINDLLLSGFLNAIQSLASEIFSEKGDGMAIDVGTQKVTLVREKDLAFAVLGPHAFLHLREALRDLLRHFYEDVPLSGEVLSGGPLVGKLRRKLARVLFREPVSKDWVPVPLGELPEGEVAAHPWLSAVDGATPVGDLPGFDDQAREEYYEVLNALHVDGHVTFANSLEARDYVAGSERLDSLFTRGNFDLDQLRLDFPGVDVVALGRDLGEFVLVAELVERHGDGVFPLLERMYELGYLSLVDEAQRRVLIAMDAFLVFSRVVAEFLDPSTFTKEVDSLLKGVEDVEVRRCLEVRGGRVKVDKDPSAAAGASRERVAELVAAWTGLTVKLVERCYAEVGKARKRFVQRVYDLLVDKYVDRVHPEDLDVLEPVLRVLELLQAK